MPGGLGVIAQFTRPGTRRTRGSVGRSKGRLVPVEAPPRPESKGETEKARAMARSADPVYEIS